jgi:hypothetical protein
VPCAYSAGHYFFCVRAVFISGGAIGKKIGGYAFTVGSNAISAGAYAKKMGACAISVVSNAFTVGANATTVSPFLFHKNLIIN